MIIVDVFVPGAAKTKGSLTIRNRRTGALRESVIGSSTWRALMAQAVRDDIARKLCSRIPQPCAHDDPGTCAAARPCAQPVAVTIAAYLRPPAGWTTRFLAGAWPIWERAGDLDKLVRNVLDALGSKSKNPKMNGNAIVDDNLVCKIIASKHVADDQGLFPERALGVRITVDTDV